MPEFSINHKSEDKLFGQFTEYSLKGIKKKQRKIVIQKGKDISPPFYGIWYIYDVTPEQVKTVGWSGTRWKAEKKARDYIKTMRKCDINDQF